MGMLDTTSEGGAVVKASNENSILFGAGLEYATRMGLGRKTPRKPRMTASAPTRKAAVIPTPKPTPAPIAPAVRTAAAPLGSDGDADHDGVFYANDRCPNTRRGVAVDNHGCALFNGILEGVIFVPESATLTADAKRVLVRVVATLNAFPTASLLLSAHTDNQGSDQYNLRLSAARAKTVALFLIKQGISRQRFKVKAYGEKKPIASNDTEEGRRQNRRVELTAAAAR